MKMPSFPCERGCACKTIRYRFTDDPLGLHICHCTHCQTIINSWVRLAWVAVWWHTVSVAPLDSWTLS